MTAPLSPTRAPGADATGMRCERCDSGAVAAEVHTVRGVPGVLCGYCASCGFVWPVPRRQPTAAEAQPRMGRPPAQASGPQRYCECGMPIGSRARRCADCTMIAAHKATQRRREAERRARERAAAAGSLTHGDRAPCLITCATPGCDTDLVWLHQHARPVYCTACQAARSRERMRKWRAAGGENAA